MRLVLLVVMLAASATTQELTLRIPLQPGEPEEIAVVTFDPNRVSADDLKKWMRLHETSYYHTPVIGYYPDCKPGDIAKLEANIKRTEQLVHELNPADYPEPLTGVVTYLRDLQSYWLWMARQELAFLKTGKLPQTRYNGLDFSACQIASDNAPACGRIFQDWHNCANNAMFKRIGDYPQEKWKAFLDRFGIQERIESTVED